MIYALRSTLKALIANFIYTIYPLSSTSYSCLLFALYALRSTLYDLRSMIYALRYTLYDLRSTICVLRCTLYDVCSTINALRSTFYYLLSKDLLQPYLHNLPSKLYQLLLTLYDLRSIQCSTIYSLCIYCNLYLHDLPSKLYHLLFALYALRSMLYDLPSTLYSLSN